MTDSEESKITEPTTSTTDHSKVKGSHNKNILGFQFCRENFP